MVSYRSLYQLSIQAVFDITPQVLHDKSLPEAYDEKHKESTKQRALGHRIANSTFKWVWMIVALLIAVAIAVGVGVGIWYHRKHSLHKSSSIIRYGVRADMDSSWLIPTALQPRKMQTSFSTTHLWPLYLSPTTIDSCFSKTFLVSSDVRFVLHQTISGVRAQIKISVSTQIRRTTRRWQSMSMTSRR